MAKLSAFETHIAAIASGTVTKTNVIGLRKSLNGYERIRSGWSQNRIAPITAEQAEQVTDMLADIKPRVAGELHDSGKAMLQNKRYRKQLANAASIIADIDHFRLVGYDYIGNRGDNAIPVYRAYDTKGASFPFRVIPWQSGGTGPEIVSSNYW